MPMSSGGHVESSSDCATRPKAREIGLTGYAVPIQPSLHIGRYVMAPAEHREPCDSRGSRTVLGAPGGEIPSGDSTTAVDSSKSRPSRDVDRTNEEHQFRPFAELKSSGKVRPTTATQPSRREWLFMPLSDLGGRVDGRLSWVESGLQCRRNRPRGERIIKIRSGTNGHLAVARTCRRLHQLPRQFACSARHSEP